VIGTRSGDLGCLQELLLGGLTYVKVGDKVLKTGGVEHRRLRNLLHKDDGFYEVTIGRFADQWAQRPNDKIRSQIVDLEKYIHPNG
jgi:hypothetical protein